jgi:ATP-dependent DNA ligase
VIRPEVSSILYCSHVERDGEALFRLACEHDLEGIVAKHRSSPYLTGREDTTWFKHFIRSDQPLDFVARDKLRKFFTQPS